MIVDLWLFEDSELLKVQKKSSSTSVYTAVHKTLADRSKWLYRLMIVRRTRPKCERLVRSILWVPSLLWSSCKNLGWMLWIDVLQALVWRGQSQEVLLLVLPSSKLCCFSRASITFASRYRLSVTWKSGQEQMSWEQTVVPVLWSVLLIKRLCLLKTLSCVVISFAQTILDALIWCRNGCCWFLHLA